MLFEPVVLAGERQRAARLRRQARHVDSSRPEIVGSVASCFAANRRRGARALGAEDRIRLAGDRDFLRDVIGLHDELQVGGDAEVDRDVVLRLRLERRAAPPPWRDDNRVRTADAHAGNREAAVGARHRFVCGSRRQVNGDDGRTRERVVSARRGRCRGSCRSSRPARERAPVTRKRRARRG